MPGVKIVPIPAERSAEAAAFFSARLADTFIHTFPEKAIARYRQDYTAEKLEKQIKAADRVLLMAILEDEIYGIMFGSPITGGLAYVIWIVVKPGCRGQGIGRQLLENTFARYKKMGAHKIVLYTETDSARDFYKQIGMKLEGVHPNHWWGVKHYCFARQLTEIQGE